MQQSSLKTVAMLLASLMVWSLGAHEARAVGVDEDLVRTKERIPEVRLESPALQDLRLMTANGATMCRPFAARALFATAMLNDKALLTKLRYEYLTQGTCYHEQQIPSSTAGPVMVGEAIDDRRQIVISIRPVMDVLGLSATLNWDALWYVVCWKTPFEMRCF
jgi:hypothetical protein